MRSPLAIPIFFVLFTPSALAQDCGPARFQLLLEQADAAVAKGEYDLAINKLQSAKVCQPESEAMVNKRVIAVFQEVNSQRKLAIQREKIAKSNELAAIAQSLGAISNNEKEIILNTDPDEPAPAGDFEGRKLNTVLALFIESFRINPSALNRAGLKYCIDQLGNLITMFTPDGKVNYLQPDQSGHNILFSSKLSTGLYRLTFLNIYNKISKEWNVSVDTIYQIIRINQDGFLISGSTKNDEKKILYLIDEGYDTITQTFGQVLKKIEVDLPENLLEMVVLNPVESRVLLVDFSRDGSEFMGGELHLTLMDVSPEGEVQFKGQLGFDHIEMHDDIVALSHNLLIVSEPEDSISLWRVDSAFTCILKKKYPFCPRKLTARRDGTMAMSGVNCCMLVVDHVFENIQNDFAWSGEYIPVQERYFSLQEWIGSLEFWGKFLLASTDLDTDYQVVYLINANFLVHPTSLDRNRILNKRIYTQGRVLQVLPGWYSVFTLNSLGQIQVWDMNPYFAVDLEKTDDRTLLKMAEKRLAFNLDKKEWTRFFGDLPYHKIRMDLP